MLIQSATIDDARAATKWLWREWSTLYPNQTYNDFENEAIGWTQSTCEALIVARVNAKLAGCISITTNDVPDISLSPWVSNLYIPKDFRHLRLALPLIKAAVNHATKVLQYKEVHCAALKPSHKKLYESLGCEMVTTHAWQDHESFILRFTLN